MSEKPAAAREPLSRAEARGLLRESRDLLSRAKKRLPEERLAPIHEVREKLATAVKERDQAAIDLLGRELADYCDKDLATFRKSRGRELFESVGLALLLALILRAFVIEAFQIPSGSMEPTLLPGDRLFVSKFSFGVRMPFTRNWPVRWGELRQGDVVVFVFPVEEVRTQVRMGQVAMRVDQFERRTGEPPASLEDLIEPGDVYSLRPEMLIDDWGTPFQWVPDVPRGERLVSAGPDGTFGTGDDIPLGGSAFQGGNFACVDADSLQREKDYIKRVIGLPGDRVRIENGVLLVNDLPVERTELGAIPVPVRPGGPRFAASEVLPSGRVYETWHAGLHTDFSEITVRPGHFFAMGDNRDHSSDSRCWGQVPQDNLKGRALFLFFSSGGGDGIRWGRLLNRVR